MTIEQIEKFIGQGAPGNGPRQVAISFKTRHTVEGIFVKAPDYPELKGKNFWRIVTVRYLDEFNRSGDMNFSRIFNGAEFTKLAQR
jgi:hypothetical protein